ncbi:MAG: sigma-70 family RNA polymerase sigma factor [Bacteroidota bacterium]
METRQDVTQLLSQLRAGRREAFDELLDVAYADLRQLARRHLNRERADHTLNATALVHEAYLRLVDYRDLAWNDRTHFFAVAAQAMRRVLSNYARDRNAQKRGGKQARVTLHDDDVKQEHSFENIIALDDALKQLEAVNERACRIVECRFFGGLTVDETAEALGISPATVARDWRMARAWLKREFRR